MNPVANAILNSAAAMWWFWLSWRSVATGRPGGYPVDGPLRTEQPGWFWFITCLLALLGVRFALRAVGQ